MLTAKDETMSTLKNSAQNMRDTANDAKHELRDAAHDAGQKVRSIYNTACDEVAHAKDTVTREIRTNPVQSSLIALGVGFVVGVLFRR